MDWFIWIGAAISLVGLVGLLASIRKVNKARKAGLSDEDLRAAVQAAMPLNLSSLFLSVISLIIVILKLTFS